MNYFRKNISKGFTLIELTFVLSIMAVLSIIALQKGYIEAQQLQAKQLGNEVFRYTIGVQEWISRYSGRIDELASGTEPALGTKTGLAWLKDASCGGTGEANFVPCEFLNSTAGTTTFGRLGFSTDVTVVSTAQGDRLTAITVLDPFIVNGNIAGDLSGLAALVAAGSWTVGQHDPTLSTSDAIIKYCIEGSVIPMCAGRGGRIVIITSNESQNDRWLRIDGGNKMQNILAFDDGVTGNDSLGFSLRQIKNVARIYNEGASTTDALFLGKANRVQTLSTAGVVVDADQEILGQLRVLGNTEVFGGDIRSFSRFGSGGNIEAERNVIAHKDVIADENLDVGQDAYVNNNLFVGKDGSIAENAYIGKSAVVGENLTVTNDFLVNRNASILGWLRASGDITSANGNLIADSGGVRSQVFFDSNDPTFFADPTGLSKMNIVSANEIQALDNNRLSIDAAEIQFRQPNNTVSSSQPVKLNGYVDMDSLLVKTRTSNFIPLSAMLPRYVHISTYTVNDGDYVPKPPSTTCPDPKIIITPKVVNIVSYAPTVDTEGPSPDDGVARGKFNSYATDNGAGWTTYLRSSYQNGDYRGSGLAQVYCYY